MSDTPFNPSAILMQRVIALSNELERELARLLGVNLTDYRALSSLATTGDIAVGRLAAALGATPATTTAIVDRLESKGFVHRQRAVGDRRQVRVSVTPDGMDRIITIMAPLMRRVDDHVLALSEPDQQAVRGFLDTALGAMVDHLATLAATDSVAVTAGEE